MEEIEERLDLIEKALISTRLWFDQKQKSCRMCDGYVPYGKRDTLFPEHLVEHKHGY